MNLPEIMERVGDSLREDGLDVRVEDTAAGWQSTFENQITVQGRTVEGRSFDCFLALSERKEQERRIGGRRDYLWAMYADAAGYSITNSKWRGLDTTPDGLEDLATKRMRSCIRKGRAFTVPEPSPRKKRPRRGR